MGEGFPGGTRDAERERSARTFAHSVPGAQPLNQWRARSAADPPRTISNRVVKRRSAEGTGGMPAGRVGPCAHHRGVEQWQLVGLITRRSVVRIHPPLPHPIPGHEVISFMPWYFFGIFPA